MTISPYLSIIVAARNDNYGGDFNERFQNSIRWLSCLVENSKLPAELLIVDYNPVPENQPLGQMISFPQGRKYLTIRILHVPAETHRKLIDPAVRKTVPLFEFPAKNMAIRRAKGEYILCTNADILLHPSIVRFIADRRPDKTSYYRTDRFDYKKIDSYDFSHPDVTLRRIQRKVFRMFFSALDYKVIAGENFVEENFQRARHSLQLFLNSHLIKAPNLARMLWLKVNHDHFTLKYHTNASGDFMLMHRDNWFSLRGYAEDTYISTHCDAIFTAMAGVSGLKQQVLRWPVYHQDHERRYDIDFNKETGDKDFWDMHRRFVNDTREMEAAKQPKIVNSPDWGHAGANFEETTL